MKFLAALLFLLTLVSCAGPAPGPVGDAAVVQPGAVCRVAQNGGPVLADRGIGGTGAPSAKERLSDRGIGGTGVVGVVTGFASICVDGVEVRFDKAVPLSINGSAATARQLRVGQMVVIRASGSVIAPDSIAQAQMISVRSEVTGPVEAIDTNAMVVAGQRIETLPSTWMAGRFGPGDWVTVSGLRRADGAIVASRLDRARAGTLLVRGQVTREHGTTTIGTLVLVGPAVATVRAGSFVSVTGSYRNGAAEVTAADADLLAENPGSYFGDRSRQLILQGFVHVEHGLVSLSSGQNFAAGPALQASGSGYRNAIVWLERGADGVFAATQLHYTNYRAQPKDVPARSGGGAGDLVLPPDAPPGPPTDVSPGDPVETGPDGVTGAAQDPVPSDTPVSGAVPLPAEPVPSGASVAVAGPFGGGLAVKLAARDQVVARVR
jgi:hypothetical protein